MIKIKLLSRMAGPDGNYPSGHILDIDKIVGKQLIDGGYAESLEIIENSQTKKGSELDGGFDNNTASKTHKKNKI